MLVTGTIDRARGERLSQDYQGSGGIGAYTLKTDEARGLPFGVSTRGTNDLTWDLQLARDLPIALTINSGVGKATIDLTGLQLTRLDVNTGVGQTIITLPAQGRFSAKVDAGVGEAIDRSEQERARGMANLARRLHEQRLLRPGVSQARAAHVIWVLASFDAFDTLAAGRSLAPAEAAEILVEMAERSLLDPAVLDAG